MSDSLNLNTFWILYSAWKRKLSWHTHTHIQVQNRCRREKLIRMQCLQPGEFQVWRKSVRILSDIMHHGKAGGLQTTSGLRPPVKWPAKLLVNFFTVITGSFIFPVPKDLKENNPNSYLVFCFTYLCHRCYWI